MVVIRGVRGFLVGGRSRLVVVGRVGWGGGMCRGVGV